MPIPPHELQESFDTLIEPLVKLCRRLIRMNDNLKATRDLLLPKLIFGKIEVPQAEQILEAVTA